MDAKKYSPLLVNHSGAFIFAILVIYPIASIIIIEIVDKFFGIAARIAVGALCLAGFMVFVRYLWRFLHWIAERSRDEAREKYRGIYRVVALPTDERSVCKCALGTEIKLGDYGWEARPWRNNGLIYLHGLNERWGLVWIAGFRTDQIEYVGPKPVSQYDWNDFEYDGPKPMAYYNWERFKPKHPCPFPVETPKGKAVRLNFPI